jgi:alpha-tubulin suppressor-like RCC1 family protein
MIRSTTVRLGAVFGMSLLSLSCRGATQVTVDISTDAECLDLHTPERAALAAGAPGAALEKKLESEGFKVTANGCKPGGALANGRKKNDIGSIVVIPSGAVDDLFGITVVAGLGDVDPKTCHERDYKGCIVARRALRFIPHTPLRLPIFLGIDCASEACSATTTCRRGTCVSAEIPVAEECQEGAKGCGEDVLPGGGGAGGAGGSGGAGGAGGAGGSGGAGGAGGSGGAGPVSGCLDLALGSDHTCVLRHNGTVACWGYNANGQLGSGVVGGSMTYVVPVTGLTEVVDIDSSKYHTCAVRKDGTVHCWGMNEAGQVQAELEPNVATPAPIQGISGAVEVSAGRSFSCARKGGGEGVWCWGSNGNGQLAMDPASFPSSKMPVKIETSAGAKQVRAASRHGCAIVGTDQITCWGSDTYGELGDGASGAWSQGVPLTFTGVKQVAPAGYSYGEPYVGARTCVLQASGTVSCWGSNDYGELGTGGYTDSATPKIVMNLSDAIDLAQGRMHACAVRTSGKVACWGRNESNQLGVPAMAASPSPIDVPGLDGIVRIAAGGNHTCALRSDNKLLCWGLNSYGQLGNGSAGGTVVQPVEAHPVCAK